MFYGLATNNVKQNLPGFIEKQKEIVVLFYLVCICTRYVEICV